MNLLLFFAVASAAAGAGVVLLGLLRQQRGLAEWSFVVGSTALTLECSCTALSFSADPAAAISWQAWRIVCASLAGAMFLVFSFTYSRGNALIFLRRWWFALAVALCAPAGLAIVYREDLLRPAAEDSIGVAWQLTPIAFAIYVLLLGTALLVLMNLERTFRASTGTMRWRIKFMLLGLSVLFVARVYTATQALLFRSLSPQLEAIDSVAAILAGLVLIRALLRSSRFPAEVYPSHSILEGSLTVVLAGIYLVLVGVFAEIAAHFGGDASFALKTFIVLLALIALAVLLQSDRVRLRLRQFISRHFQRPLYDYRTVWKQFTDATASCITQADLCRSVVKLTADLFQALSVSIWLTAESKQTFVLAASTILTRAKASGHDPTAEETAAVCAYFAERPGPVDIESAKEPAPEALRRWQPSEFPHGGHRVCVPLRSGNRVVGVLTIGDRVAGVPFSDQDLDLLKCIADQSSSSLVNLQLSAELVQIKELEAFQAMATFFVHDLKNAASTLNLMLQNLPVHFADPAFRADALRGMEKTVAHINALIGRLTAFRSQMALQPKPTDLNELVAATLADFVPQAAVPVVKQLHPLPTTLIDREQIQKVLINLLLNASEAAAGRGEIKLLTEARNGSVVLSVSDNGCGMAPEFIERSLFRPFQTTKKAGLGIGMFQSKMIVDAHRGRITVASAPGVGTTFEVHLPIRGNHS